MKKIINFFGKYVSDWFLVFVGVFVTKLFSLGYDIINNDAFHWKERGYEFGSALMSLDFARMAVTYHPGVTLLYLQFISNKIYSLLKDYYFSGVIGPQREFFINHSIQKFVVVLAVSLLTIHLFNLLKSVTSKKIALLSVLLLSLEPFYIVMAREIHLDALLTLFMFISLLYYYLAIFENTKIVSKNVILSGVFLGSALLTKSNALVLVFIFLFIGIYIMILNKSTVVIRKSLASICISMLSLVILWPAMWVSPINTIKLYFLNGISEVAINEGHLHMWFGKEISNPGAFFYFLVLLARFSPFLITFFIYFLVDKIIGLKQRVKTINFKNIYVYMAFYFIVYFIMVTMVTKKLDRYILPLAPVLVVYASYILSRFNRQTLIIVIAVYFVQAVVILYSIHPNYLAYYSILGGGFENGRYIIEPKWIVGYNEIAKYFNNKKDSSKLGVAIADFDYLRPFANFKVYNIKVDIEAVKADFFVLPVYREDRNEYYRNNYELEKVSDNISIAGIVYYEIYRNRGPKRE